MCCGSSVAVSSAIGAVWSLDVKPTLTFAEADGGWRQVGPVASATVTSDGGLFYLTR